jgi:hypothetical protein
MSPKVLQKSNERHDAGAVEPRRYGHRTGDPYRRYSTAQSRKPAITLIDYSNSFTPP